MKQAPGSPHPSRNLKNQKGLLFHAESHLEVELLFARLTAGWSARVASATPIAQN
jgi:hypothetical protein